jgi:hypothetical protein
MAAIERQKVITSFPNHAKVVAKSDTVNLTDYGGAERAMYIFVGTAGTVRCLPAADTTTVDVVLPDGGYVPFAVIRVYNTGTTATNMLAVW